MKKVRDKSLTQTLYEGESENKTETKNVRVDMKAFTHWTAYWPTVARQKTPAYFHKVLLFA